MLTRARLGASTGWLAHHFHVVAQHTSEKEESAKARELRGQTACFADDDHGASGMRQRSTISGQRGGEFRLGLEKVGRIPYHDAL